MLILIFGKTNWRIKSIRNRSPTLTYRKKSTRKNRNNENNFPNNLPHRELHHRTEPLHLLKRTTVPNGAPNPLPEIFKQDVYMIIKIRDLNP